MTPMRGKCQGAGDEDRCMNIARQRAAWSAPSIPGELSTDRLSSRPFFLVGAERSGTTLLRLLLDRCGQLSWRGEFEFAVETLADRGRWRGRDEYVGLLRRSRVFAHWRLQVREDLPPAEVVHDFLLQWRERSGKPLLGATIHKRLDLIPQIWPRARYVHIIRDPRDVAASMVAMKWDGNVWHSIDRWIEVEEEWSRLRAQLAPEDWIEVRFESLLEATRFELERLCRFLGVRFEETMMSPGEGSSYAAPDARMIGQWRRRMTPRDLRLVEAKAAPLMRERGYEPSGVSIAAPGAIERTWLRLDDWLRLRLARLSLYGPRLVLEGAVSRRLGGEAWRESVRRREHAVIESLIR